jgi:hypothetical protein
MKKIAFKKLALTSETIRTLNPAELQHAAGGQQVVVVETHPVPTTHSIGGGCSPELTTITFTVNPPRPGSSGPQMP